MMGLRDVTRILLVIVLAIFLVSGAAVAGILLGQYMEHDGTRVYSDTVDLTK
jgi:hypothetical protein